MAAPVSLALTAAVGALVAAQVAAEWRRSQTGIWLTKVPASTGFVALGLANGALDTTFGQAVLAALALSWLGDVLLIPKRFGTFLAGLVAFLLGHVAYAAGFALLGLAGWAVGVALAVLVPFAAGVGRWLLPHVEKPMLVPVLAYMVVITAMVALASGAAANVDAGYGYVALAGAILFFLSDLAVARDRFVREAWLNRAWGLPAYYGGQMLLAWSVVGA